MRLGLPAFFDKTRTQQQCNFVFIISFFRARGPARTLDGETMRFSDCRTGLRDDGCGVRTHAFADWRLGQTVLVIKATNFVLSFAAANVGSHCAKHLAEIGRHR